MLKIVPLLMLLLISGNTIAAQVTVQGDVPSISDIRTLIEQGRDNDATRLLGQLVQTSPENFQAWFLLGVTQAKQRRFHDAVVSFGKVISLQPKLAEPHNNLAVIYNELGDFRAAVKELEASLTLKPDYVTAHENIGDLYVKLAAAAYRKALEGDSRPALRQRYERLLHIRDKHQPDDADAGKSEQLSAQKAVAQTPVTIAPAIVPEAEKHASGSHDHIQAAMRAVETWRSAWNRQDLPAYFAAYSDAFDFGTRFETLEQWKRYKQRVIAKRAFIRVTLENIEAKQMAEDEIKLVFLQHFRSDSFNSDDIKEMLLRKTMHGWKIIDEASQ